MATVSLENIQKTYPNGFKAIHGIDLQIQDGEFIVIVGPSGCGKSTLLRMIAGLETISDGMLQIGGRQVNDVQPADRDIAMVFQNYALYPHMSVYNNMAYALKNMGMEKSKIEEKVKEVAKILELNDEMLQRRPNQLSGGQRQRVAMGRAIVRDPAAFLFDEPLSNLDAKLRVQMRLEIKQLQRRLNVTSIYVTHDQIEAMTLADRLVVMHNGIAEQIGTPMELYERPETVFVAQFIGSPSMNIFAVEKAGTSNITLPGGKQMAVAHNLPEDEVLCGIRPEDLERCSASEADVTMTVSVIEPLGADTFIIGSIGDGMKNISARLNGRPKIAEGEIVPLALNKENLHLFNAKTEKRIK